MVSLRKYFLIGAGLLLTVVMAGCGMNGMTGSIGSGNTGSATKTTTGSTTKPQTGTMNNQSGMTTPMATVAGQMGMATPTAGSMGNGNMNGSASTMIHVAQVNLNGKTVSVLTTAKGMMLYYRLSDPAPKSTCTGACAKTWPPLLGAGMTPTSSAMLPKKLSVYMTANGNQVEYDGHPLYTYAGDMTPGQFNGRGMGMVWYLVGTGL